MSGFHPETVRLPAGRPPGSPLPAADCEGEPVVLRFPARSRAEEFTGAADRSIQPLWIRGYRGKRTFDMVIGGLLAFALMPVAAIVSSILALLGRGSVLDREEVVGSDGQLFRRLRFRTRGALRCSFPGQDREGQILPLFGAASVPRTRFGWLLHATGLERLPELWNVLRGDLALIGPAARTADEAEASSQFPPRWDLKPGFIWVVAAEPEHEAVMRYVATQGTWTDLRILSAACWRLFAWSLRATRPK